MATKPNAYKGVDGKELAAAIANASGANGSVNVSKLAQGDIDSIRALGAYITGTPYTMNGFLDQLLNRVALVLYTSKSYDNPHAKFKRGMLEYGETVQDALIQLAEVLQYNPADAETTLHKRYIPNVKTDFYHMNFQKVYPITVSRQQLHAAFLSYGALEDFVEAIIKQLYTASNYDEFLVMRYMIGRAILDNDIIQVPTVAIGDRAGDITVTKDIRKTAIGMSRMGTAWNKLGNYTYTDFSDLYVMLTDDAAIDLDVEVLSNAYHMSKAEIQGHIETTPMFGNVDNARLTKIYTGDPLVAFTPYTQDEIDKLNKVVAVVFDKNWFAIWDNLIEMQDFKNGKGLYWNYFLHHWQTLALSKFVNVAAIVSA